MQKVNEATFRLIWMNEVSYDFFQKQMLMTQKYENENQIQNFL